MLSGPLRVRKDAFTPGAEPAYRRGSPDLAAVDSKIDPRMAEMGHFRRGQPPQQINAFIRSPRQKVQEALQRLRGAGPLIAGGGVPDGAVGLSGSRALRTAEKVHEGLQKRCRGDLGAGRVRKTLDHDQAGYLAPQEGIQKSGIVGNG